MKKMSRLLALVMALVLALGSFTTAMAEESNGFSMSDLTKGALDDIAENAWAYYATEFYKELMATTTQEEFENVQATHPLVGDKLYSSMTEEQRADLFAHNVDLSAVNGEALTATAEDGGVVVDAPAGAFPTGTEANVAAVTDETVLAALTEAIAAVDETAQIVSAYDINFNYSALGQTNEVQPKTAVPLTFEVATTDLSEDCTGLAVYHMAEDGNGGYTAELVDESELVEDATKQTITIEGASFSIYVVTDNGYSNDWNFNLYELYMVVGDTLTLDSTTNSNDNTYTWSITDGDSTCFTLENVRNQQVKITANSAGRIVLNCRIKTGNNSYQNDQITVVAVNGVNDIDNDIIFKRITTTYENQGSTTVTDYGNTRGEYVMKIRFEDLNGKVIDMGNDYYVFDSVTPINIDTFAKSAPQGYTYVGAFFFWTGHAGDGYNDADAAKVYVTSVERKEYYTYNNLLWYGGTHETGTNAGSWAYQPSGVLHIVYAPVETVYTVEFVDHDNYNLAQYGLVPEDQYNKTAKFPNGYVANIDNMVSSLIPGHHSSDALGYEFTGNWVVSGGGSGIDGTYETKRLKEVITSWSIKSDIVITAQCIEPEVTINYVAVGPDGATNFGSVSPTTEEVKVVSEDAKGSTATANTPIYRFVGWYDNADCDGATLSTDAKYVPKKVDGKNVAATYYAKFELDVAPLIITKNVIDADTTDSVTIDANQEFKFNVTIGDTAYAGNPIKLKNGESATISNITIGTTYVIEEIDVPVGYENTTSGLVEGKMNGTIAAGETTNTVIFTNTLKVGDLTIDKTITGGDTNTADDVFTFEATIGDEVYTGKYYIGEDEYTATDGEIKITESQTAIIKDIPIKTEYSVSETAYPDAGYNVDSGKAPAAQTGTMDADGQNVTFTNVYTTATLTISKTVEAKNINVAKEFTFTVSDLPDGTYSYMVGQETKTLLVKDGTGTLKLKHGETAVIAGVPVNASYKVAETADANYTTTVTGAENGTLTKSGARVDYTNIYKTGSLTISKSGIEAVDNHAASGDSKAEWQSTIYHVEGTAADTAGIDVTVVIYGNDRTTITNLPLGNYTVTELTDWAWRYTADDASQDAVVDVDGETVSFSNSRTNPYWLNGDNFAENIFSAYTSATTNPEQEVE